VVVAVDSVPDVLDDCAGADCVAAGVVVFVPGVACCAPAAPDSAKTIAPPSNIDLHPIDASPSLLICRKARCLGIK
jgi:hypothetical protein